jgi:putative ABC transport system substrate-binding protein
LLGFSAVPQRRRFGRAPAGRSRHGQGLSHRIPGFALRRQSPRTEAFRAGLRDLGYQEGRDIVIEYHWADSHYDRLPALLAELINLNVDVIVTHGTPGVAVAKQATSTIPIVIAVVGDAVESGLVASLARPGGNVTGLTFFSTRVEREKA